MGTLLFAMENNDSTEIRSDLVLLLSIVAVFVIFLAGLKIFDSKTGEIAKIGSKLISKYVSQ